MSRKKTTSEVMRERQREFDRQQREDRDAFDRMGELMADLCNAGLVDDVEPDNGVIVPIPPMTCMTCGATFPGIPFGGPDGPIHCPVCHDCRWTVPQRKKGSTP